MDRGCVIFDFDGVIADTEAQHLISYNEALVRLAGKVGTTIRLDPGSYYGRYIAYGNREGFERILTDAGRPVSETLLDELCHVKDHIIDTQLSELSEPLAGVRETLGMLNAWGVPVGICSGARKVEIISVLTSFKLLEHFPVIVTIEDVRRGKPDPEGYSQAFDTLQLYCDGELNRAASLVIEDTAGGAAAAHGAGLRVVGVATSSAIESVRTWADFALADLTHLKPAEFKAWLKLQGC